ncbi:MAG: hypothetical protein R3A13_08840 [Bdellovibrionota bacterium]
MLNLIGLGHAYPETVLDNDFLSSLPAALSAQEITAKTGIAQRCSSLSKEYILETFNQKTKDAKSRAICTPTDLGVKAAEMALENANLSWEDIGLIMGDGATPVQTTPGESQRVGNASGLKIPAYDVFTPSAGFALTCQTLRNWKAERVPKYILSVSSHTPTQLVNYAQGHERYYYGDAASAVIFSLTEKGLFTVNDAHFTCDISQGMNINFNTLGHATFNLDKLTKQIIDKTVSLFVKCQQANQADKPLVILSALDLNSLKIAADKLEISSDRLLEVVSLRGNALSATTGAVLSENAATIESGQKILCALAEGAVSFGYVLLTKN